MPDEKNAALAELEKLGGQIQTGFVLSDRTRKNLELLAHQGGGSTVEAVRLTTPLFLASLRKE